MCGYVRVRGAGSARVAISVRKIFERNVLCHICMSHVVYDWVLSQVTYAWVTYECNNISKKYKWRIQQVLIQSLHHTHSYVTWLVYIWHGSFICHTTHPYMTWPIHTQHVAFVYMDMPHNTDKKECAWRIWHCWPRVKNISGGWSSSTHPGCRSYFSHVIWPFHMQHRMFVVADLMTQSLCRASSYWTWLIHMWHDSFVYIMAHMNMWHDAHVCIWMPHNYPTK